MTGTNSEGTDEPLRILMTADAVGGVWRYSVDLIDGLCRRGAKVLLATMGQRPSEDQKREVAAIPNVKLAESDYALEWMPHPWADVDEAGEWLLKLASDFEPDLVHLNGYAHAALPWRRPLVVAAHSCVFSWWRAVHGCAPGQEWNEYSRRVLAGLHAAGAVIAPSAAMARALTAEYAVRPEKIRVIHNFSPGENPERTPKQAYFLAAGRIWDQAKNVALLQQIAPRLNWDMRISGDRGSGQSESAGSSASFLGMLPYSDLLQEMAHASVFVHPALYEPFGLSVLEAARRRCCLVLADIPSLRELWAGAAVFVNPRNPDAWVDELNRLTIDVQRREELGARACAHAARYSEESSLADYQHVYSSVLKRGQVAA